MNKFCEHHFTGLFLNTNGDIKFCCAGSFPLGNIKQDNPSEILLGKKASKIRENILLGKRENYCSYCDLAEKGGSISQRKITNPKNFSQPTDFQLTSMDLRWDNTCNLSCVYCNSQFSSKWASILKDNFEKNSKDTDAQLLEFIKHNKDDVFSVQLLGGEPLLQKQNLDLIDILPDKFYYVLSNMAVDVKNNDVAKKLLTLGKKVKWAVSFETIKDKFEYIRHGAKWNIFEENVKYIRNVSDSKLTIHATYCLPSALSLVEFCDYVYYSDYYDGITFQLLTSPRSLNIFAATPEIKKIAIEQLDICIYKYESYFSSDIIQLVNIRESLLSHVDDNEVTNVRDDKIELDSWVEELETKLLKKDIKFYNLWNELNGANIS